MGNHRVAFPRVVIMSFVYQKQIGRDFLRHGGMD